MRNHCVTIIRVKEKPTNQEKKYKCYKCYNHYKRYIFSFCHSLLVHSLASLLYFECFNCFKHLIVFFLKVLQFFHKISGKDQFTIWAPDKLRIQNPSLDAFFVHNHFFTLARRSGFFFFFLIAKTLHFGWDVGLMKNEGKWKNLKKGKFFSKILKNKHFFTHHILKTIASKKENNLVQNGKSFHNRY